MDNCIANENVNNDFLSQSYAQGIERITGTKDSILDFQVPKELLEVREKTWDNLFNKYSKGMSDDIEINVDTLEPEEEEEEKTFNEEGYSCGHRVPMRKPATLVQYWINTGNQPYKMLLDKNELSEIGLSLSEKEITSSVSPSMSLVTNNVHVINNNDRRKSKNDSSCSSVDTAAYILSNVNITKKADTIAIMEGAKCIEVKSLKNIKVPSNNKIEYMETTSIDRKMRNDDDEDVNVDVPATELHSMSKGYIASEIDDGVPANTRVSADTIQSSMHLPCEDKIDKLSTSQRNLDVQTINDIASIFRQFDETSKRLSGNDKNNDVLDQRDKALEIGTFREKQDLENISEIIAKDTSSSAFHRKKLYTGRDSPVDLILTETHSINRLSQTRQNPILHPALDPDGTIKRKTFLIDKDKRKRSSKKSFVSNQHKTNNKNNVKLKEVKIVLERLSTNVCLEGSNVAKTNIFSNKTNVSQNTNLQINDKRKSQICETSKILDHKNGAAIRSIGDNYSLRKSTRSKKNNGQISDTIDIITERGSQVFDKIESDSTFQLKTFRRKNCSKVSQDHNKKSVLTFTSSDEDDFIQSIHARKRLKVSINDDNTLGEPNIAEKNLCDQSKLVISDENKYRNRNSNMIICSSEKTVQRDIGSIKEKKKHIGVVKIKSFRSSTQTATATSRIQKNERFKFFASENNNDDNAADNSDKRKERISFFNTEKNINHNSKRRSKRMIKKNGINHKDDIHIILFQTKTFDANSSDFSEESNNYTSSTCKALKSSSVHNRLRYKRNRIASKEIFNDSITKRHSKRHLSSSNYSLENNNWMKRTNVRTRTRSIYKEVETNEEPNGDFKSRKDESFFSLTSDVRDTSIQEETFSNTFLEKINFDILPENKEILDKCKNSVVTQQNDVTSTVRKLLTFETKNYYNSSDSSETL